MRIKRQLKIAWFLVFAITGGCAHVEDSDTRDRDILRLTDVTASAPSLDGQYVSVSGYLIRRTIGGYYLYTDSQAASSEQYAGGVDIVTPDKEIRKRIEKFNSGRCVVISGKFKYYRGSLITTGNLRSKVGFIEADGVRETACLEEKGAGKGATISPLRSIGT